MYSPAIDVDAEERKRPRSSQSRFLKAPSSYIVLYPYGQRAHDVGQLRADDLERLLQQATPKTVVHGWKGARKEGQRCADFLLAVYLTPNPSSWAAYPADV